ncbi:toxin glutamine deamidase domain-containing protein [Nocardia caishijiensis]|uniref:toxin glutamine deamidase domain-containing protein n=1 Tax=Nocardia caishijiensis TaxID=184756 RepID=UPI0012EDB925|nr:toxin glutamine deamidase domain-containing protein [Nocardia caishijiensis]
MIVFAAREASDTPPHELDSALESALLVSPTAVRAIRTPAARIEFTRVIADDNGGWRLDNAGSPRRLLAEPRRTGLAQHMPATIAGWLDATGNRRFVDESQPWRGGRGHEPEWFGDGKERDPTKEPPKGITGWAMDPVQTSVLGNLETLPPGHVFKELTPAIPTAPDHFAVPFEVYSSPIDGLLYNAARLVLETVGVFAGVRLRRDPLNPARLMVTYKWHPKLGWFARRTNPDYRPLVDVQPRIHQWDEAEHAVVIDAPSVPLQERQQAEQQAWAQVQDWADTEYRRFRDNDHDIDRIVANLAARDEDYRIRHADKLIDKIRSTVSRLNDEFGPANDRVLAKLTDWVAGQLHEDFRAQAPNIIDAIVYREMDVVGTVADRLAGSTFTHSEIGQIKNHLMRDRHLVIDRRTGDPVRQRMDAVADIAEAWIRLTYGEPMDADILLLQNSLAGSRYLAENADTLWREADRYAIGLGLDWNSHRPPAAAWRIDIKYAPQPLEPEPAPLPPTRDRKPESSRTPAATPEPTAIYDNGPSPATPLSDLLARAEAAEATQRRAARRIAEIAAAVTGSAPTIPGPRALGHAVIVHIDAELTRPAPELTTIPTDPDHSVRIVWERLARDQRHERLTEFRADVERQLTRYLDAHAEERELRSELRDAAAAEALRAAGARTVADRIGILDGDVPRALVLTTNSDTEPLFDDKNWRELTAAGTEISFQRVVLDDAGQPHLVDWRAPSGDGQYRTANDRLDAIELNAARRIDEVMRTAIPPNTPFVNEPAFADRIDETHRQVLAHIATARATAVSEIAEVGAAQSGSRFALELADAIAEFTSTVEQQQQANEVSRAPNATWTYGTPRPHATTPQVAANIADLTARAEAAMRRAMSAADALTAIRRTLDGGARPVGPRITHAHIDQHIEAAIASAREAVGRDGMSQTDRIARYQEIRALNALRNAAAEHFSRYRAARTDARQLSDAATELAIADVLAAAGISQAHQGVGMLPGESGRVLVAFAGADPHLSALSEKDHWHRLARGEQVLFHRVFVDEHGRVHVADADLRTNAHDDGLDNRSAHAKAGTPHSQHPTSGIAETPTTATTIAAPAFDIIRSVTAHGAALELRTRLHIDHDPATSPDARRIQAIVDTAYREIFGNGTWYSPRTGEPIRFSLDFVEDLEVAHLRSGCLDTTLDIDAAGHRLALDLRAHLGLAPTNATDTDSIVDENDLLLVTREARLGGLRLTVPDIETAYAVAGGRSELVPLENHDLQVALEHAARLPSGEFVRGFDPRTSPVANLINPGGYRAPGRGYNCWVVAVAGLLTFLGDPQVARPVRGTEGVGSARDVADWLHAGLVSWNTEADVRSRFDNVHSYIAGLGPGAVATVHIDYQESDANGDLLYDADGTPVVSNHALLIVFPLDAAHPVWWCPQAQEVWDSPPADYITPASRLLAIPIRPDGTPALDYTDPDSGRSPAIHHPSTGADLRSADHPVRVRLDSDSDRAGTRGPTRYADRNAAVRSELQHRRDNQLPELPDSLGDRQVRRGDDHRVAAAGRPALSTSHPDPHGTDVQRDHARSLPDPSATPSRGENARRGVSPDDRQAGVGLQSHLLSRHSGRALDPGATNPYRGLADDGHTRGLDSADAQTTPPAAISGLENPPRTGTSEAPPSQTGGAVRPRDLFDSNAQDAWAEAAYDHFRTTDNDVTAMAEYFARQVLDTADSAGYSRADLRRVKNHLFRDEHPLNVYDEDGVVIGLANRRYEASADIAEAWMRLSNGTPLPEDLILLDHELAEMAYYTKFPGASYREAHHAADQIANWEKLWQTRPPVRTGENFEEWIRVHGDQLAVSAEIGDRAGGDLPVRAARQDGSRTHDQQGGLLGDSGGRDNRPLGGDHRGQGDDPASNGRGLGEVGKPASLGQPPVRHEPSNPQVQQELRRLARESTLAATKHYDAARELRTVATSLGLDPGRRGPRTLFDAVDAAIRARTAAVEAVYAARPNTADDLVRHLPDRYRVEQESEFLAATRAVAQQQLTRYLDAIATERELRAAALRVAITDVLATRGAVERTEGLGVVSGHPLRALAISGTDPTALTDNVTMDKFRDSGISIEYHRVVIDDQGAAFLFDLGVAQHDRSTNVAALGSRYRAGAGRIAETNHSAVARVEHRFATAIDRAARTDTGRRPEQETVTVDPPTRSPDGELVHLAPADLIAHRATTPLASPPDRATATMPASDMLAAELRTAIDRRASATDRLRALAAELGLDVRDRGPHQVWESITRADALAPHHATAGRRLHDYQLADAAVSAAREQLHARAVADALAAAGATTVRPGIGADAHILVATTDPDPYTRTLTPNAHRRLHNTEGHVAIQRVFVSEGGNVHLADLALHRDDLAPRVATEHGSTHTTIGTDTLIRRVATNLRNLGHHDVVVHGNESGLPVDAMGNPVDPQLIIGAVRANPNYQPGTPIRLVSCHSGSDSSWAQQLADALDVEVHAPTDIVGVRNQPGSAAIVHNDGHWRTFEPSSEAQRSSVTPATGELADHRTSRIHTPAADYLSSNTPTPTPGFDITRQPDGTITRISIRIHLRPETGVSTAELADIRNLTHQAIAEICGIAALADQDHLGGPTAPLLLPDGSELQIDAEFVDRPDAAHLRVPITRVRGLIPHGIPSDATPREVAVYLRDHFGLQPHNNTPDKGMRLDGMELYEFRDEIAHQIVAAGTRSPLPSIAEARARAFHPPVSLEHQHYQEELRASALDGDRYVRGFDPRTHPAARLINPGGLVTPSRTANCWEATVAAIMTFYGAPTVARAAQEINLPGRLPEYRGIGDLDAVRRWLGAASVDFAPVGHDARSSADRLHALVAELGPGSSAFVGLSWPGGGRHMLTIVYPDGAACPVWWDAQSQETWDAPPRHIRELTALTAIPLRADGSPFRAAADHEQSASQGIPREEPPMGIPGNGDSPGIRRRVGDSTNPAGPREPYWSADHDPDSRDRSDLPVSELVAEYGDRAVSDGDTERRTTWSPDLPLSDPHAPEAHPRRGRPGLVPGALGVTDPTRQDRTGLRPDHLHEELRLRPVEQPLRPSGGPRSESVRDSGHLASRADNRLLADSARPTDEGHISDVTSDPFRSTSQVVPRDHTPPAPGLHADGVRQGLGSDRAPEVFRHSDTHAQRPELGGQNSGSQPHPRAAGSDTAARQADPSSADPIASEADREYADQRPLSHHRRIADQPDPTRTDPPDARHNDQHPPADRSDEQPRGRLDSRDSDNRRVAEPGRVELLTGTDHDTANGQAPATSRDPAELFDPTVGGRRAALALAYARAVTGNTAIQIPDSVGSQGMTFDEFTAAAGASQGPRGGPGRIVGTLADLIAGLKQVGDRSCAVFYQLDDSLTPLGLWRDPAVQQALQAHYRDALNAHAGVAVHRDGQISFYDPATHTISPEAPLLPMAQPRYGAVFFDSSGTAPADPGNTRAVDEGTEPGKHQVPGHPPTPHDGPAAGGRRVALALSYLRDSTASRFIEPGGRGRYSMSDLLSLTGHRYWTTFSDPGWIAGHLESHGPGSTAFIVERSNPDDPEHDLNNRCAVLTNRGGGLITVYDPALNTSQEYRPGDRTIRPTQVLFHDIDGHPIEPDTVVGESKLTDQHLATSPRPDEARKPFPIGRHTVRRESVKDSLIALLERRGELETALRDNTFTPAIRDKINKIDASIERLPKRTGPVHRLARMAWTEVNRYQTGGFVQEPGYVLATTKNFEPNRSDINVHFTITARSARAFGDPAHLYRRWNGTPFDRHEDIVFERGTSFSVTNRVLDPRTGILHIDLVELAVADSAKPSRRQLASDYTEPDANHRAVLAINHIRAMTGSSFIQPQPVDRNHISPDQVDAAFGRRPTTFRDPAWIEAYLRGHGHGSMAMVCVQDGGLSRRNDARSRAYNDQLIDNAVNSATYVLTNDHGEISLYDPATRATEKFSDSPHYRKISRDHATGFLTYFVDPTGLPVAPTEPGRTVVDDNDEFQKLSQRSAGIYRGRVSPQPISLTSADRAALRNYNENLDAINEDLRTGGGLRWTASEQFHRTLAKFPDYRAVAYRVETLPIGTLLTDYTPGSVVRDSGHAVASKKRPQAVAGDVEFTILSSTGKDVGHYFSRHQNSIVFGLGTEFRVISRHLDPDTGVMEVALMETSDLHRALDVADAALTTSSAPAPPSVVAVTDSPSPVPQLPVDIHRVAAHGMTLEEITATVGRPATPFSNSNWIARYLDNHGPGSSAIVSVENQNTSVARRRLATTGHESRQDAVRSESFLLTNQGGRISVYDPTTRTSTDLSDESSHRLDGHNRLHTFFFDPSGAPMVPTESGPTAIADTSDFRRHAETVQNWYRRNISPRSLYMSMQEKRGLRRFVAGTHTPNDLVDFTNALTTLPVYRGLVYRVDSLPLETIINDYRPGSFVSDWDIRVASKSPAAADAGQVAFRIMSSSGKDVSAYARKHGEPVVILQAAARYQVISRHLNAETGVMEITLLDAALVTTETDPTDAAPLTGPPERNEQVADQDDVPRVAATPYAAEPATAVRSGTTTHVEQNDFATPPLTDIAATREFGPGRIAPLETQAYQDDVERAAGGRAGFDPRTDPVPINDGGMSVPGRFTNCVECVMAGLSSFFGRPTVAFPRESQLLSNGTMGYASGESPRRVAQWLGADLLQFDPALDVTEHYRQLHDLIAELGPGSAAFVATRWQRVDEAGQRVFRPDGSRVLKGGHASAVVFPLDADGPVWWDPQSSTTDDSPSAKFLSDAGQLRVIVLRPDGSVYRAGTDPNQGRSRDLPDNGAWPRPEMATRPHGVRLDRLSGTDGPGARGRGVPEPADAGARQPDSADPPISELVGASGGRQLPGIDQIGHTARGTDLPAPRPAAVDAAATRSGRAGIPDPGRVPGVTEHAGDGVLDADRPAHRSSPADTRGVGTRGGVDTHAEPPREQVADRRDSRVLSPLAAEVHAQFGFDTEAGVAHHAHDPAMADLADRVRRDDRYFTADVHLDDTGAAVIGGRRFSPEEYGDLLSQHTRWDGRTPVRLIGCDAASVPFAARLAAHLGTDVLAPTARAWTDEHGRVYTSGFEIDATGNRRPRIPPDGQWITHHPDGTTTLTTTDGFAPGTPTTDRSSLDPNTARERGWRDRFRSRPRPEQSAVTEPSATDPHLPTTIDLAGGSPARPAPDASAAPPLAESTNTTEQPPVDVPFTLSAPAVAEPAKPYIAPDLSSMPPLRDFIEGSSDDQLMSILSTMNGRYGPFDVRIDHAEYDDVDKFHDREAQFSVKATVHDPESGNIGKIEYFIYLNDDGALVLFHQLIKLDKSAQGQGFAVHYTLAMNEYYGRSDLDVIEIKAGLSGGGYAWARRDFLFDPSPSKLESSVQNIIKRIRTERPKCSPAEQVVLDELSQRLSGAIEHYPKPREIADLAGDDGTLGKRILRGSEWWGRIELNHGL